MQAVRQAPVSAMIVALYMAELTAAFETSMIFAAIGKLLKELGDPVKVGWLVTGYMLTSTAAVAVVARMGDLHGRMRIIVVLLALALLGSLLSALGGSYVFVVAGRVIQGFSGAILPLCFGIVRAQLPALRVPIAVGLISSAASAGAGLGLVLGGLIVDHYGWHAIFYASAMMSGLSLILVALYVPRDRPAPPGQPVAILGGLLFVPAIAAILLYFSNIAQSGWTGGVQLVVLATSLALLGMAIFKCLRDDNPLIDVRLFANRTIALTNLIIAVFGISALQLTLLFSTLVQAPKWTGIGLGASATAAGLIKFPSNLIAATAGPISGWLAARHGGRSAMLLGIALTALGWGLAMVFHQSVIVVGLVFMVVAFGTGFAYSVAPNLLLPAVSLERSSEATGIVMMVRSAFMAAGAQLLAIILATDVVQHGTERYPSAQATMLAMGLIVAACGVAAVLALLLPRDNPHRSRVTASPETLAAAPTTATL